MNVHRPQNARPGRLRPGQRTRRRPERRARRPDGAGRACRRRSPGPGGRRLGSHRQPAVVAVPQPRTACRTTNPRLPRGEPLHRHRRKRAAVAGQSGLPRHYAGQGRHGADRRRRVAGAPGRRYVPGEASWTGPNRTTRYRSRTVPTTSSCWQDPSSSRSTWTGPPTSTRCSSRLCGSRRVRRPTGTAVASASCGPRFSAVAQHNPHAWNRDPVSAEEIWQPGPDNRMISWPYTKLMNSNNMVDQGAALILTSVEKATHLQIPTDRWVFPYAGTDAHDTYLIGERAEFDRSPAIRIAGPRALELAGIGIDDVDLVDVYSCFPSAVQVAANELGLPLADPARPLTVTGGLTFAGGPWNNYVSHSIATHGRAAGGCARQRRASITANGGYLTKHSFGIYGTEPPEHRVPLGGRAIRRRRRADPGGGGGVVRGRHRRDVDHAVHQGRCSREGIRRRPHARRHPCVGGARRSLPRPRPASARTSPAPRFGCTPTGPLGS